MVKYQHRDNSICIIKSDAGKEWRMMKKVDKKKIILSVLLSSMLWSNSLYAYELKGDESGQVDSSVLELFESITIAGIQTDEILQLKNNEELTINGVKLEDTVFNNVSEVKNSKLNTVYGGLNDSGNDNKILITNSILSAVTGGAGTATANENIVNIKDSLIVITDADMGITGGFVSEVSNGEFTGLTSADNNIVNIDNSSVVGQYIVGGRNDRGQANNNVVSIKENNFVGVKIIGGWSEFGSANNNIIEINGYNNLISTSLYGYYAEEKSENREFKNNTLIVNDFNGGIMEVANFNKVTFNNLKWNTAAVSENNVVVDISGTKIPEFKTDGGMYVAIIDNVDAIEIGKLGNNNLKTGDKAWLIFTPKNNNDKIHKFDGLEFKNYSGVAKIVSGNLLYEVDVELTASDGSGTTKPQHVGALSAVVTGVERNKQTDLVASNRAVAAAFVNQGTDLIADSLDTLSRDGKYGVKTFAAVHGNRSKYDVNNDIKINGWSTIVGVGAENEHNGGDFS